MSTVRKLALPLILVVAIVGIGIGLLLGWQVWPVQWYDTDPSDLRLSHQQTYVEMVADSLAVTGDTDLAATRLLELTDQDTSWDQVANLVEETAAKREQEGDPAAALRIQRMAQMTKLPIPTDEPFEPASRESGISTRNILLVAAVVAFFSALVMLIWVVARLIKGRKPQRDQLGPIPQAPELAEQPLAQKPAAILWEEPIDDEEETTPPPSPATRLQPDRVSTEAETTVQPPPAVEPESPAKENDPESSAPEKPEQVDPVASDPDDVIAPAITPTPAIHAQPPSKGLVPESVSADVDDVDEKDVDDDDLEAIFAAAFSDEPLYKQSPPKTDDTPSTAVDEVEDLLSELSRQENPTLVFTHSEEPAKNDAEQDDSASESEDMNLSFDTDSMETIELTTVDAGRTAGSLGVYDAEYHFGDDDFDCSFTIETPDGEFLGECGVGISDVLSADDAQRVNAFEVWLFDKSDIRTVSKVLVSQRTFEDPDLNDRLSAKGDLVMARQSSEILLETLTLQVSAVVTNFGYLREDPSMAAFSKLNVQMVARRMD